MKKRSGFTVMVRLIGLVKPLSGYMVLAILMGLVGHLCAAFITIFGGFAVLDLLGFATPVALKTTFVCVLLFALVRGIFRYAEQSCNHFIAFKLLALIRDKAFRALRRLCPAKLEGRDRGDLISVITSDIELLEVFYAHTISPAAIAALFTLIMCLFIGHYHALLGLLALAAYVCVGVVIPLITSRRSCDTGMRFRTESGALSAFVLDSLRGFCNVAPRFASATVGPNDENSARTAMSAPSNVSSPRCTSAAEETSIARSKSKMAVFVMPMFWPVRRLSLASSLDSASVRASISARRSAPRSY